MRIRFWHKVMLSFMILYDLSLHFVKIFDIIDLHPFYPYFPLWETISYDLFWTSYWGIAFIISLWIIFGREKN